MSAERRHEIERHARAGGGFGCGDEQANREYPAFCEDARILPQVRVEAPERERAGVLCDATRLEPVQSAAPRMFRLAVIDVEKRAGADERTRAGEAGRGRVEIGRAHVW